MIARYLFALAVVLWLAFALVYLLDALTGCVLAVTSAHPCG